MIVRRILALIIDLFLYYLLIGHTKIITYLIDFFALFVHSIEPSSLFLPVFIFILLFHFVIVEVIFLTSIGKWLFNLRLRSADNKKIDRLGIFIRGILKLFSLTTFIGSIANIILLINKQDCWYDALTRINLEYYGKYKDKHLTEVQKEWRKHFENK